MFTSPRAHVSAPVCGISLAKRFCARQVFGKGRMLLRSESEKADFEALYINALTSFVLRRRTSV